MDISANANDIIAGYRQALDEANFRAIIAESAYARLSEEHEALKASTAANTD